jgi:hypothetical protein
MIVGFLIFGILLILASLTLLGARSAASSGASSRMQAATYVLLPIGVIAVLAGIFGGD